MQTDNVIVTGYYGKQNYGDDLFQECAESIFATSHVNIIPIDNLLAINNAHLPCATLVLFGGETLNDYFLDILIRYLTRDNNKQVKAHAIGVSTNQTYASIVNKVQIFDSIVFRSLKDYDYFKAYVGNCRYCPDIVFYHLKEVPVTQRRLGICQSKNPQPKKIMGFFLSQTALGNPLAEKVYLDQMLVLVRTWLGLHFEIIFFAMCTNKKPCENDNIINKKIYDLLTTDEKKQVLLKTDNREIMACMPLLQFAVCWRYHAHILCIKYAVPFLSLSETPKVLALLKDNDLTDLAFSTTTMPDDVVKLLMKNYKKIKEKLSSVFRACNKAAQIYKDLSLYKEPRLNEAFYLHGNDITLLIKYILKLHNETKLLNETARTPGEADDEARLVIFTLLKTLQSPYSFGLAEKLLAKALPDLQNDLQWLIRDCIQQGNQRFYFASKPILQKEFLEVKSPLYNVRYIDQLEYDGLHRSGWSYVVHKLYAHQDNRPDAIKCDLYVDSTFHWNREKYVKLRILPYVTPWIGFIHHTCYTKAGPNNTENLFKEPYFLMSLHSCKGLFVLSSNLKVQVRRLLTTFKFINVPVHYLVHPTEFVGKDNMFSLNRFKRNKTRYIVQVGAWLRNMNAINLLPLGKNELHLRKAALQGKKMEGYYCSQSADQTQREDQAYYENIICPNDQSICRDTCRKPVILDANISLLKQLTNAEYDKLLSENVVFINLVSASAVNTIIECIVRHTPIVVNRLPATLEALGAQYPLFYDNIQQVPALLTWPNIKLACAYLQRMDKTPFRLETFIEKLKILNLSD